MAEKWRKAGARVLGLKQVKRKIIGKLNAWDYLPLGEKIGNMQALLGEMRKAPGERSQEFRFLNLAPHEYELTKLRHGLKERLKWEKRNLEDMRGVFSHYGIDLGRIGVSPEHISYPYKTKWRHHKGRDFYYFTSPGMARWFDENVTGRSLQPSYYRPPKEIVELIGRKKIFGLGRLYPPRRGVATIGLVQPLVFYKSAAGKGDTGVRGMKGTPHRIPLEHPELFLLYAQLKEARGKNAKQVRVREEFWSPYEGEPNPPFTRIYDRISKLSHPFKPVKYGKTVVRAVFKSSPEGTQSQEGTQFQKRTKRS